MRWASLLGLLVALAAADLLQVDDPAQQEIDEGAIAQAELGLAEASRKALMASQTEAQARGEANDSYQRMVRLSERLAQAQHKLQAAQEDQHLAHQDKEEAASLVKYVTKQLDRLQRVRAEASSRLKKSSEAVAQEVAHAKANQDTGQRKIKALKQDLDEIADRSAAALRRKTKAATAALVALKKTAQDARVAQQRALQIGVERSLEEAQVEQLDARSTVPVVDTTVQEAEEAKARETSLAAENLQERVQEADDKATRVGSEKVAIENKFAVPIAETRSKKQAIGQELAKQESVLAQLESDSSHLHGEARALAAQVAVEKEAVSQTRDTFKEKRELAMEDQLEVRRIVTLAQDGDTPELRQVTMETDQAQKAVEAATDLQKQAGANLVEMQHQLKLAEKQQQRAKVAHDAETQLKTAESSEAQQRVAQEQLRLRAVRERVEANNAATRALHDKDIQAEKAKQRAAAEVAAAKRGEAERVKAEASAAEAEALAEATRLEALKAKAVQDKMVTEQKAVEAMRQAERAQQRRVAELAAQKRRAEKDSADMLDRAESDASALEKAEATAQQEALAAAKQSAEQFEDTKKQSEREANNQIVKSEVKAQQEKQAADSKTSHMLSLARSTAPAPCNSTGDTSFDTMQEALDIAHQEANAQVAVTSAKLGKEVAAQEAAGVAAVRGLAQTAVRDAQELAVQERKNREDEAARREQQTAERLHATKAMVETQQATARRLKQSARAEDQAARKELNAQARILRDDLRAEQAASAKAAELKLAQEAEAVRQAELERDRLLSAQRVVNQELERSKEKQRRAEVKTEMVKGETVAALHKEEEREAMRINAQQAELQRKEHEFRQQQQAAAKHESATGQAALDAAQSVVDQGLQNVKTAKMEVDVAESTRQEAVEQEDQLQDRLAAVKAAIAMQIRQSQEKMQEFQDVARVSQQKSDDANQKYKAALARESAAEHRRKTAKADADAGKVKETRSKIQVDGLKRKTDDVESELRRLLDDQASAAEQAQFKAQHADESASSEKSKLATAEQEANAEQRELESEQERLQQKKDQAAANAISEKTQARQALAKLNRESSTAESVQVRQEAKEEELKETAEVKRKDVLDQRAADKVAEAQLESQLLKAQQQRQEMGEKLRLLEGRLQRQRLQFGKIMAVQDEMVSYADSRQRLAEEALTAATERAARADKALQDATELVATRQQELAAGKEEWVSLRGKRRAASAASQLKQRARDAIAAKLAGLRAKSDRNRKADASVRVKAAKDSASGFRREMAAAIEHLHLSTGKSKQLVASFDRELADRAAQLEQEKSDSVAKAAMVVRKAQSESERAITRAEGEADRIELRARASEEKERIVTDQSQKQRKLADAQAYEGVREAKQRAEDAEDLVKLRGLQARKAAAEAKRAEARKRDTDGEREKAGVRAQAAKAEAEEAGLAKAKVEATAHEQLGRATKTKRAARIRSAGYERKLDGAKEAMEYAKQEADKNNNILTQEKDRLREVNRESQDAVLAAKRQASLQISKSKADLRSVQIEQSNQLQDVKSELESRLAAERQKWQQRGERLEQKAGLEADHEQHAYQLEINQAKRQEQQAVDRRLDFEKALEKHQRDTQDWKHKTVEMKSETGRLRNALFNVLDRNEDNSIDRQEFEKPMV